MFKTPVAKQFDFSFQAVSRVAVFAIALGAGTLSPAYEASADTATYDVTFTATWGPQTHPTDFPPNPHFSGLVGATHNGTVGFWSPGAAASNGVEDVAETGGKSGLIAEVNQAIANASADQVLSGGGIGFSPGAVTYRFTVDREYPLVTLLSMVAPSPDWIVGVHDLSLLNSLDKWRNSLQVSLDPYDAGTDSGASYLSGNRDTQPRQAIRNLRGIAPFSNQSLGTMRFTRVDDPLPTISVSDVSTSESAGTATLTLSLSKASSMPVSVTVESLDGTAQEPGDYMAISNTIEFSPGVTEQLVIVSIIDDSDDENDETLFIQLSNSVDANIARATATVTIIDDDGESAIAPEFARVAELLQQNDPVTKTIINDIAATVSSEFGITLDPAWVRVVNRFGASNATTLRDRLDPYKTRADNYFLARRRAEDNGKTLVVWKQRHAQLIRIRARRGLSSTEAARLRTAKAEITKRTRLQNHWKTLRDRHNRILNNKLPAFDLDGTTVSYSSQRNLAALL